MPRAKRADTPYSTYTAYFSDPRLTASAAFALLGIIYLAPKIIAVHDTGIDFRVLWIAGKAWNLRRNPYHSSFLQIYHQYFGIIPHAAWLYPPCWYPISATLALLPFRVAFQAWKALNFILLIGTACLSAHSLASQSNRHRINICLFSIGFAAAFEATADCISTGQTSIVIAFGLSMMMFGLLRDKRLSLIAGLSILLLKPNIGGPLIVGLFLLRSYRSAALAAIAICGLASIPAFTLNGLIGITQGFLWNISHYGGVTIGNAPQNMTGITQILNDFFSLSVGPLPLIGAATLAVGLIFFRAQFLAKTVSPADQKIRDPYVIIASTAAIVFFVPLHYYDFVLLVAVLAPPVAKPSRAGWLMLIGLAICWRATNLALLLGIANPRSVGYLKESLLSSLSLIPIVSGAIWAVARPSSALIVSPLA